MSIIRLYIDEDSQDQALLRALRAPDDPTYLYGRGWR